MPNWKKVIVSGSDAILNQVTASGGILTSQNIMPDADNTLSLGSSTQRFQLNGGTPVTVDGSGTANTLTRFQSATTVEDSSIFSSDTLTRISHDNDGNDIFIVSGSNGELIKVTDSLTDTLFQVNDGSGITQFEVSSSGTLVAQNLEYTNETFVLTYNSASGNINFFSASAITGTPTLQEVTDEGSSTTNNITTTNSVFASTFTGSLLRLDENGTGMRMTNVGAFENSSGFHIFSNNALRFSTNGSSNEAINIDTSQNVTLSGKLIVPEKIEHSGDTNTSIDFTNDAVTVYAGGLPMITVNENGTQDKVVINENSNDIDFRVEGNNSTHLLFTDAGSDRVGINTSSPSQALHVSGALVIDEDNQATTLESQRISVTTTATAIANITVATHLGAIIDYTVYHDNPNEGMRTGQIMAAFESGGQIIISDTSTGDIGDTSAVTFSETNNGTTARITLNTPDTDWNIRTFTRLL